MPPAGSKDGLNQLRPNRPVGIHRNAQLCCAGAAGERVNEQVPGLGNTLLQPICTCLSVRRRRLADSKWVDTTRPQPTTLQQAVGRFQQACLTTG